MIFANGKLYTFSDHLDARLDRRGIKDEWIEQVMNDYDRRELSNSSPNILYIGFVEGRREPLFVAVDEDNLLIKSAYFQRPV